MHKLTVARTARYATAGAAPAEAKRLWIAFHGYGNLASDFIAPIADAAPVDTRVVAPEGLSRFYLAMPRTDGKHLQNIGATWLTRDDREDDLRDALAMLHAVVAREHAAIVAARGTAPTLGVLGFSQGVAMSMRWVVQATQNPALGADARIATHVLWAGGLAHDVENDALRESWRDTALHVVAGTRDAFATEASHRVFHERLQAIGVRATEHQFDGGHRLHTPLLAILLPLLPTPPLSTPLSTTHQSTPTDATSARADG